MKSLPSILLHPNAFARKLFSFLRLKTVRFASGLPLIGDRLKCGSGVDATPGSNYKQLYKDVPEFIDLWWHFVEPGFYPGRNFNPIFDSEWYRKKYLDEAQGNINPFLHFLQYGAHGDYNPCPLFDAHYYLSVYPDVERAGLNPLVHYLAYGSSERRNPSPFFEAAWYLDRNPDVKRIGINPLSHYLLYGAHANKNPNPYFDTAWYREKYLKNADNQINPLVHYILIGEKQGNQPSSRFHPELYLLDNPDVADAGASPLQHFLQFGLSEGRPALTEASKFSNVMQLREGLGGLPASTTAIPGAISLKVVSVEGYIDAQGYQQSQAWVMRKGCSDAVGVTEKVTFPSFPYVAKLDGVLVLAGTRFVLTDNDTVVHDEEFFFRNSKYAALKYVKAKRGPNGTLELKFSMQQASWVDAGINLMHEYSYNYFHFIAETIPRMLLAEDLDLPQEIPYIFEDGLHPNMRQLIDLLNYKNRPVIYLQSGRLYSLDSMYLPSDMSSVIDAYDCGPEARQTVLEVGYIAKGVKRCMAAFPMAGEPKARKIYIRRPGTSRILLNQPDLETRLAGIGFEILTVEALDIEQQIKLFRDAGIVIAPTGAHLTNIVWCSPGTKVIVLASDHPSHQLYLWQLLGKVSSCEVNILQGPRAYTRNDKYSVHDDYYIDVESVVASITN